MHTEPSNPLLSDSHRRMLCDESRIRPEIISERGYRTINAVKELADLGFAPKQRRVPGLLIPVFAPDGSLALHQYRPDSPRQKEGKNGVLLPGVIKYETIAGASMRIDVPPSCRSSLADPSIPLWITEGIKKGDALASAGFCAAVLLGVWNFKGKNSFGGITFLADFDYIALNGRDVRIVFDSDIMDKPGVRQAMERLTEHLQRKGAHVRAVYLPGGRDEKVGVDDYLREHGVTDLEKLIAAPRPAPQLAPATYTLLDEMPPALRRPLQIINGQAYAATWLVVRKSETEDKDRDGNIIKLNPPRIKTTQELFIIRDDGVIFGNGGHQAFTELGFDVHLSEVVPDQRLMRKRSVEAYAQGQRAKPSEVFERVRTIIDRFIDFERSLGDQRAMSELIACYVIATWFLDAFNVAGYIWPTGERGSGKTQLLTLMCELGYLGQIVLASGTMATLRDLADYGAFLGFDDAENLTSVKQAAPDKRTLLLAGNRRGNTISVKEPVPGEKTWRTRYVQTFSFRGFTATRTPDPVLSSRTISVPLIRTGDRKKANADVLDFKLWPCNRDELVGNLWMLSLANLARLSEYDAAIGDKAKLSGRNLEAWRAVLAVALWLENEGIQGLFGRMEGLSVGYQRERRELEKGDMTSLVLRAIVECIEPQANEEIDLQQLRAAGKVHRLRTDAVTDAAQRLVEVEELDFDSEHITTRSVGRILGKLRFRTAKIGANSKSRGWEIVLDDLERLLRSFSLISPDEPESMPQTSPMSSCPLAEDENRGHEDINSIKDIAAGIQTGIEFVPSDDLEAAYQERAAIMEYDGGLARSESERLAAHEIFNLTKASLNAA